MKYRAYLPWPGNDLGGGFQAPPLAPTVTEGRPEVISTTTISTTTTEATTTSQSTTASTTTTTALPTTTTAALPVVTTPKQKLAPVIVPTEVPTTASQPIVPAAGKAIGALHALIKI